MALNKLLVSMYLGHLRFVSQRYAMKKLGTAYGGWYVPVNLVGSDWICYSAGAGEDISFDLALHEQFGCPLWIFDPTPRAISYVCERIQGMSGIQFKPFGLWSSKLILKFYQPRDPKHVSHSIVNLQRTNEYFEAECFSLSDIMAAMHHERIDLLKIDIEGAEHEVIRDMVAGDIRPKVLCVEIDQPVSSVDCIRTLHRIKRAGYELSAVDGWNFSFVKKRDGNL